MSRRGKRTGEPATKSAAAAERAANVESEGQRSRWKLWCLRFLAMIGVPVLLLAVIETSLRVFGYGYPTAFLLTAFHNGEPTLVQNNQFGWRFFGQRMSRLPHPISISPKKPLNTVRIFVFGESAAYGDPQPRFGLPRMMEALLSLRHPDVRFEVVNAAMTGINSHVIVQIAHDCAQADGDIWVIYMGNNEVVGPFGAGTIFGRQVPPLQVVHANVALKQLRIGQLLDSARQWAQKAPPEKSEWGGMMMFLQQQVRADDPRMSRVYEHFERNLAEILRAGKECGVGVVVSTVAVNLKACAPFASAHRVDLTDRQKREWEERFNRGVDAQAKGQAEEAAAQFRETARLDDRFAALRFRQGECALALGEIPGAQRQFIAARDLDTLRFRCDSRLNESIRRVASRRGPERILLADANQAFAEPSPNGLPGEDLFYEHVHLTFEGNYLLARTIAAQVEKLLPERVARTTTMSKSWPSSTDCARRLGWNRIKLRLALNEELARQADPPFTGQLNHAGQVQHLMGLLQKLSSANSTQERAEALQTCEQAAALTPDDPFLQQELASLKQSAGDLNGAAAAIRRSVDLLPTSTESWALYGLILAQEQKFEEAAAAFKREFELDGQDVGALQDLAMCLVKENRRDEAVQEYRRALNIKPRYGPAWLGLGQTLEALGRKEEAMDCFAKALTNRIHRAEDLTTLARFCGSRGWHEAAVTNYIDALKLSPWDAALNYETGENLAALGRHGEAAQQFARAAELSPGWGQAQYQCGVELGQAGQPAEASTRFKDAVRLMPELLEARLNLGIALSKANRNGEALEEFEQVLQRNPANALALEYIQTLRHKVSGQTNSLKAK
ncbi:MAG TPA: tetratricopeptide repeat protein [Candidatus Limnocylindrales bacterium]|nr:tetratricopeptide repeat protein [Candidatus Limnocylindrales bacterium]